MDRIRPVGSQERRERIVIKQIIKRVVTEQIVGNGSSGIEKSSSGGGEGHPIRWVWRRIRKLDLLQWTQNNGLVFGASPFDSARYGNAMQPIRSVSKDTQHIEPLPFTHCNPVKVGGEFGSVLGCGEIGKRRSEIVRR